MFNRGFNQTHLWITYDKSLHYKSRQHKVYEERLMGCLYELGYSIARLTGLGCVTKIFPRPRKIIWINFMLFPQSN